eukprot:6211019-Pleurochrysis_carterae.AAC.1
MESSFPAWPVNSRPLSVCKTAGAPMKVKIVRNSGGPLALQRAVVVQLDAVVLIVQEELEGLNILRGLRVNEINLPIQSHIPVYSVHQAIISHQPRLCSKQQTNIHA